MVARNSDRSAFEVDAIFQELENVLKTEGPEMMKGLDGVYAFKVVDKRAGEGIWTIDFGESKDPKVEFNSKKRPDVTLTMAPDDLAELFTGMMAPERAFFQGKMKVQGSIAKALKLKLFQQRAIKAITNVGQQADSEIKSKL